MEYSLVYRTELVSILVSNKQMASSPRHRKRVQCMQINWHLKVYMFILTSITTMYLEILMWA